MNSTPLVIGIGSNTTDRQFRVEKALEALCGKFTKASMSDIYESPAFNGKDDPYVNAVFSGFTNMSIDDVKAWLKETEKEAGRDQIETFEGHVVLDLDLVIWDRRIIRPTDFDRPYFNVGYRQLLAAGAFQYDI